MSTYDMTTTSNNSKKQIAVLELSRSIFHSWTRLLSQRSTNHSLVRSHLEHHSEDQISRKIQKLSNVFREGLREGQNWLQHHKYSTKCAKCHKLQILNQKYILLYFTLLYLLTLHRLDAGLYYCPNIFHLISY